MNILSYGSVYQSGYVFSINDGTALSTSVGGKVAALNNETVSSVKWSPSNDIIYGIGDASTNGSASPNTNQKAGQAACKGATDGACNTTNIVVFYSPPTTNPATNPTSYAAGLCNAKSDTYADWYLPAICETGFGNGTPGSPCGTSANPRIQNMYSNLLLLGYGQLNGYFWSSTELSSASPALSTINSWERIFRTGEFTSTQYSVDKSGVLLVRCVRAMTQS